MSAQTATLHYKSCNGKIANPFQPNCTAISPGDYGHTQEAGDKAAFAAGWSQDGNRDYCPMCTASRDRLVETTKPERKPRAKAAPETFTQ